MKYFEEVDLLLDAIIRGGEEGEKADEWYSRIKKEIKEMIWESYKNGQKSARKPKLLKKDELKKPPEPKQAPKTEPKSESDAYREWIRRIPGS